MSLKSTLVEKFASNAKVVQCEKGTSLKDALAVMEEEHIGSLCIVENGKVCGIFTERDFLLKVGRRCNEELLGSPISEFMTEDPVTIEQGSSIYECMIQMKIGNFRHLILVDEEDQPVRMISIRDAFHYLFNEIDN